MLQYDPVAVDTTTLRAHRDSSSDPKIRAWIKSLYDQGKVLRGEDVAENLCRILENDTFGSGDVRDATSDWC